MLRYPQLQSTAVEAVQLVSFSWDPSEPRQHMSPHGHVGHLWQLGRHIRFWDPGRRERPQHRFCQSRRLPKQCGLQPGGFQQPRFQYLRAGDLRSDKLREVCRKHRARRLQCRGPHARHCLCRRAHVPFDVRNRSGDYGLGFGSLSLRKARCKRVTEPSDILRLLPLLLLQLLRFTVSMASTIQTGTQDGVRHSSGACGS